jgi:hypothetical protein
MFSLFSLGVRFSSYLEEFYLFTCVGFVTISHKATRRHPASVNSSRSADPIPKRCHSSLKLKTSCLKLFCSHEPHRFHKFQQKEEGQNQDSQTTTMPQLSSFLKMAAAQTAKGAAVTLTSTVAACGLACYIEIGAHRLVYHYFPHKYANVEHANGLTQDQLDAVRVFKTSDVAVTSQIEEEQEVRPEVVETVTDTKSAKEENNNSRFWSDMPTIVEQPPTFLLPSQDILACAMTG